MSKKLQLLGSVLDNKEVLDKFSEDKYGNATYNGKTIKTQVFVRDEGFSTSIQVDESHEAGSYAEIPKGSCAFDLYNNDGIYNVGFHEEPLPYEDLYGVISEHSSVVFRLKCEISESEIRYYDFTGFHSDYLSFRWSEESEFEDVFIHSDDTIEIKSGSNSTGSSEATSVDWSAIENKPFDGTAKVISWNCNTEGLETVDLLGMATLYKVSDDFIRFNEADMAAGKYYAIAGEIDSSGIVDEDKTDLSQVWELSFEDLGAFCVNVGESFAMFPHFASVVEDNTTFTVDGTPLGMGTIEVTIESKGTYFAVVGETAVTELGFVDVISQIPVDFIPEEAFCTAKLMDYGSYSVLKIIDRHGNEQTTYIYDGTNGVNGKDGKDGADGKTPVKGEDYFTADDKAELVNDVLSALPNAEGVEF